MHASARLLGSAYGQDLERGVDMIEDFLLLKGVTKRYGGTIALDDVSLRASRGSIHAIFGENGAGKSTLMKVLAGVVRPDEGTVVLDGVPLRMTAPADALREGVVCIFQELSLIPHLSVAENICLGRPPRRPSGVIDRNQQQTFAAEVLDRMGFGGEFDLRERCVDLALSRRQIVEIAKAVIQKPRVLILDEATSALPASDAIKVMNLLRELRDDGVCVIFISHRMHEVDELADTCSVFRSGQHVETFAARTKSHEDIIRLMIGRPITQVYPAKQAIKRLAPAYLDVKGLTWGKVLAGIDLHVRRGEVVGLGGLDGQGQRELLLALGGILKDVRGQIRVGERSHLPNSPKEAKGSEFRVAFVPEERKTDGLFVQRSVADNLSASALHRVAKHGVIDRDAEQSLISELIVTLRVKAHDLTLPVATLSGGNQQKVLLGKWLATRPSLLLLMDPTRGIDVGTKQEIYRLLRELASDGMAVLLFSSDYDELIGLCDRVLVMYGGCVRSELSGDTLNEQQILMDSMNLSVSEIGSVKIDESEPMRA